MEWTSFRNKLRLKPNSSECKTKRKIPKRNAKLQQKQVRVMSHRREGGREGGKEGGREGGKEGRKDGSKEDDAEKQEYKQKLCEHRDS